MKRITLLLAVAVAACSSDPGPPPNNAPLADAGPDITVPWGQVVVLRGSCSDADPGHQADLAFEWTLENSPGASAITPAQPEVIRGRDGPDAFFDADAPGDYVFSFQCTDPVGAKSALDTVTATVELPLPNKPPTVDAGADVAIDEGDTALLVALASDPDGDSLGFAWTIVDQPPPSQLTDVDLSGANTAEASITPDRAGIWTFGVAVDDGNGGTATDQIIVTVNPVFPLDGELAVTVVDADDLTPIAGASVALGATEVGTTDATGVLVHTEVGLLGPVDVSVMAPGSVVWDHDLDPATADVTAPEYRVTTMTGVDRRAITIAVQRTRAGRVSGGGQVVGSVPAEVFDRLPAVDRFFSTVGAQISGQLRLVLIMPLLPRGALVGLQPGDFLSPSLAQAVPLPGNMATDDLFLNENSSLFDRSPGPNGEPAFTLFEVPCPSGTQRFVIIGGIATVDLVRLLPLLFEGAAAGSFNSELGVVLGAIDLTTLFVGIVSADVPAGGEVDITSTLSDPTTWDAFETVVHTTAQELEIICDADGNCLDLNRLRLFPVDTIDLTVSALPADPRLAAQVPATSKFEVFCGVAGAAFHCDPVLEIDLAVPASVDTAVPYGLNLVVLEVPPGHALSAFGASAVVGFQFARAPGLERATTSFAVPALSGRFAGLSYEVGAIGLRRMSTGAGGRFGFQPGRTVLAASRLSPGAVVDLTGTRALRDLPSISEADAGLEVEVLFSVDDNTVNPPNVVASQAMTDGLVDGTGGPDLPASLTLAPGGAALTVLTLYAPDRNVVDGDETLVDQPRWDVLFPGDATQLILPAIPANMSRFSTGDEVWTEVAGYRFNGSFSYQAPDPAIFAHRRRAVVSDTWSFRVP